MPTPHARRLSSSGEATTLRMRLHLSSDAQAETSMAAAAPFMRASASHNSLRPVTAVWLSRSARVRSSTAAVALRIELEQQPHARRSSVESRQQIELNASNESVSMEVGVEAGEEAGVASSVQQASAPDARTSASSGSRPWRDGTGE